MFEWGAWMHLTTALLQMAQVQAKMMGYRPLSSFLQLFIPFAYFFPSLYVQYITAHLHKDQNKNDEIMRWFTLETFVFNSQVFGGILFMISAYFMRFYSIWN